jgi:hypothetical protein
VSPTPSFEKTSSALLVGNGNANVSVTMNTYVQAVTPAKRKAQRGIIKQIREVAPDPNLKCLQVLEMVGAIGFEPMTSTV